eukprot:12730734-Alexandrium_andersonii.AAC.1
MKLSRPSAWSRPGRRPTPRPPFRAFRSGISGTSTGPLGSENGVPGLTSQTARRTERSVEKER